MDKGPVFRRVLVLGGEARSTLSIVRSLGRAGIEVDLAWCEKGAIPASSRYVAKWVDLPLPLHRVDWCDFLETHLRETSYDLVIPSGDLELLPLMLRRVRLERVARLAIPSDESFRIANDKQLSAELAGNLGISVPPWIRLLKQDDYIPGGFRFRAS